MKVRQPVEGLTSIGRGGSVVPPEFFSFAQVRRNLKPAALPPEARVVLDSGASSKRVLRDMHLGRELPLSHFAGVDELLENRIVDRCLEEALPWLRRLLSWHSHREQFLDEADRRLWRMPPGTIDQPHPSSPKFEMERYRPSRQMPTYAPDLIEYMLEWFLAWASAVLACRSMRDRLLFRLKREQKTGK